MLQARSKEEHLAGAKIPARRPDERLAFSADDVDKLEEDVERQITAPIEQAISGLPGLDQLRSISKFGLSQVVVVFKDGTDIYFARQLINERF